MRFLLVSILCPLAILSSCRKENKVSQTKDRIVIGDYSDMRANNYDTILKLDHQSEILHESEIGIDINNDNIDDYKLNISNGNYYPIMKILSLSPNSMLDGELVADSTFYHVDGNKTYYSCRRMTENDAVKKISPDVFILTPKEEKDIINSNDYFKSDTVIFIDESYSDYWGHGTYEDYYDNTCNNLPSNVELFIGIKLLENNLEKLGWIKILILDNNVLVITESAVQR